MSGNSNGCIPWSLGLRLAAVFWTLATFGFYAGECLVQRNGSPAMKFGFLSPIFLAAVFAVLAPMPALLFGFLETALARSLLKHCNRSVILLALLVASACCGLIVSALLFADSASAHWKNYKNIEQQLLQMGGHADSLIFQQEQWSRLYCLDAIRALLSGVLPAILSTLMVLLPAVWKKAPQRPVQTEAAD